MGNPAVVDTHIYLVWVRMYVREKRSYLVWELLISRACCSLEQSPFLPVSFFWTSLAPLGAKVVPWSLLHFLDWYQLCQGAINVHSSGRNLSRDLTMQSHLSFTVEWGATKAYQRTTYSVVCRFCSLKPFLDRRAGVRTNSRHNIFQVKPLVWRASRSFLRPLLTTFRGWLLCIPISHGCLRGKR